VCVDFVSLTSCTAFDIGHNKVMHVGPPVVLGNEVNSFGNFRMASSRRIIKKVCYPPFKTVVFHDNKSAVLVEVVFHIEVEVMGGLP